MKKIGLVVFCLLYSSMALLTGCKDDGSGNSTELDPPVLISSTPVNGATGVAAGDLTIVLTYDQNVTCPSVGHSSITLGDATINSVSAKLKEVTIEATGLKRGTTYELVVPADVVLGPTKVSATKESISFTTVDKINVGSLVASSPSTEAKNVYNFLIENYGSKVISSSMANVNWNTNEAEWVKQHTGKYPAINTFDYIHLYASPATWIDYSDISVVEDWWKNNGIVSACWHWFVPTYEGSDNYTYKPLETTFKASNALVEGTWENEIVTADIEKLAGYLKLLQEKNIPVLWRPFHEAAGNTYNGGTAWFWWGAGGADTYKALWKYMFDYFEAQGLNNLIWIWTTETGDNDFYPGDKYVDIIGRDLYNNTDKTLTAKMFETIQQTYPTKMVTLSECGNVASISDQWSAGAKWSYIMPWYDYDRTNDLNESDFSSSDHEHANADWWKDAFNQNYVITRDEMPSLK